MQLDTGILAEVQEVLDQADQAHHARQAELYQQWSSQVFDRIQVDPLKKDLLMTQAEKSLLQTCRGKCSSADSRFSSTQLERAALRSTLDVANPADLAQKRSHVYLDDYNTPAPEYYKPSKHMAASATQGGRSSFFDLMQGRTVSSSDSKA
eukprot:gene2457-2760_t